MAAPSTMLRMVPLPRFAWEDNPVVRRPVQPPGSDQSNLSGASRKAKRSRWVATTPFRRSTSWPSSLSIATCSASGSASSVTTAAGNLTKPF
jgi:hypothetical protein